MSKFLKSKFFKKAFALVGCVAVMCSMALPASAASEDASAAVSAISSAFGDVTSVISISNILSAIGIALGAAVLLFFFWWGLRKVIRMVMTAFKKGKVSV